MLKGLKNLLKGVYSISALNNSLVINYRRYSQYAEQGIADVIEAQDDELIQIILDNSKEYIEQISSKETSSEQIIEMRKTILAFLEENIQSQIYLQDKWDDYQRKKLGQFFLPDFEDHLIPDQQRSNYIICTILFNVFCLISLELYKDKNSWVSSYKDIYRQYIEHGIDILMHDDPNQTINDTWSQLREAELNLLLEWQYKNVFNT